MGATCIWHPPEPEVRTEIKPKTYVMYYNLTASSTTKLERAIILHCFASMGAKDGCVICSSMHRRLTKLSERFRGAQTVVDNVADCIFMISRLSRLRIAPGREYRSSSHRVVVHVCSIIAICSRVRARCPHVLAPERFANPRGCMNPMGVVPRW